VVARCALKHQLCGLLGLFSVASADGVPLIVYLDLGKKIGLIACPEWLVLPHV
jgi:hypothetical protein